MNWTKRINKTNLLLVLGSLIFAFIIGEIAARVLMPELILEDEVLRHRHRPGFGWDKDGFKNQEVLTNPNIVAIGDSQTEGNNAKIEEAWPQLLSKISGKSVYQMALGGYGPVQYYSLFKDALNKKPGTIIIGFYSGNDLMEVRNFVYASEYWKDLRSPEFVPSDYAGAEIPSNVRAIFQSGLEADSFSFKFLQIRNWIRNHSRLYMALGRATRSIRENLNIAETKEEKSERIREWAVNNQDVAVSYDQEPINTLLSPIYRMDTVDLSYGDTLEGWRISKDLFNRIKEESDANGIDLYITYIPTKEYVFTKMMKMRNEKTPDSLNKFLGIEEDLKKEFFKFCNESKIECIDVSRGMIENLNNNIIIYPHTTDGHPVARGYQVIAEEIYKYIYDR